jgi:hypothetical protein
MADNGYLSSSLTTPAGDHFRVPTILSAIIRKRSFLNTSRGGSNIIRAGGANSSVRSSVFRVLW